MLTQEQFIRHLRDDLNHLQDPEHLRRSPLAALFGLTSRFDTPSRLQAILVDGIQAMEPAAGEPEQSRAWRRYEALYYRYVEQFTQQEVSRQLGICPRHVRREQRAALEILALRLWNEFGPEAREERETSALGTRRVPTPSGPGLNDELAWLREAPPEVPADLGQTLAEALGLAQPLAERHGVRLSVEAVDGLPRLAVHPVALSEALLSLLGVAIHQAPGGEVVVVPRSRHWAVNVRVRSAPSAAVESAISADDLSSLDIVRLLATTCGGALAVSVDGEGFDATLTLPALEQMPVLVIDDNADTLQLLQRYATGTRYRLITTRDPEQALPLAERHSPRIIVLDVMMPQIDGWKVLGLLKQSPHTHRVPVVVCTILAQEDLAISLGASCFVRKPVTRQDFLAALDAQAVALATGLR